MSDVSEHPEFFFGRAVKCLASIVRCYITATENTVTSAASWLQCIASPASKKDKNQKQRRPQACLRVECGAVPITLADRPPREPTSIPCLTWPRYELDGHATSCRCIPQSSHFNESTLLLGLPNWRSLRPGPQQCPQFCRMCRVLRAGIHITQGKRLCIQQIICVNSPMPLMCNCQTCYSEVKEYK